MKPPTKPVRLLVIGLLLAATSACKGQSLLLDLRDIEQPILLNGDPFVGGQPPGFLVREVDAYAAEVSFHGAAGGDDIHNTQVNDAQALAFEKIAASPRAITDLSVEVSAWGSSAIVAVEVTIDILLQGIVREYARR